MSFHTSKDKGREPRFWKVYIQKLHLASVALESDTHAIRHRAMVEQTRHSGGTALCHRATRQRVEITKRLARSPSPEASSTTSYINHDHIANASCAMDSDSHGCEASSTPGIKHSTFAGLRLELSSEVSV